MRFCYLSTGPKVQCLAFDLRGDQYLSVRCGLKAEGRRVLALWDVAEQDRAMWQGALVLHTAAERRHSHEV
jgi:hypothetical protein